MEENDDKKAMCMFILGMNIEQILLEQCLKLSSTTLAKLLSENPKALNKIVKLVDFQRCLSRFSLSEIQPHYLEIPSLDTIFSVLCGELFWNTCLKGESLGEYLNSKKHLIFHLYKYKGKCCLIDCKKYFSTQQIISRSEWECLFSKRISPWKEVCSGICERVADEEIRAIDINTDLSKRLLRALCSIFISVEYLAYVHNQICRQPMNIQLSDTEFYDMKTHIQTIAKFCGVEEEVNSKLNEFDGRTLTRTSYMKIKKKILDISLTNPDVIQDGTLHEKVKEKHTSVQRFLNKEEIDNAIKGRIFTLNIINGECGKGQLKSQIDSNEEIPSNTTDIIYLRDTDGDGADKEDEYSLTDSHRSCCIEKVNYIRLCNLITEFGQKAFLTVLKTRMPGVTSYGGFFNGMKDRLTTILNADEKEMLFPSGGQYKGDLTNLDISILYKILRNLNTIPPPTNGWGKSPEPDDKSLSGCIERIRVAKNNIKSHQADCQIPYEKFEEFWKEIREAIGILTDGKYADNIDEMLCSPIDKATEDYYIGLVKQTKEAFCKDDHYVCGRCSGISKSLVNLIVCGRHKQNTSQISNLPPEEISPTLTIKIEHGPNISVEEINTNRHLLNNPYLTTVKAEYGCVLLWLRLNQATFNSVEHFFAIMEDFFQTFIRIFIQERSSSNQAIQIGFKFIEPDTMCLKNDRFYSGECGHCFDTFSGYADHKAIVCNMINLNDDKIDVIDTGTICTWAMTGTAVGRPPRDAGGTIPDDINTGGKRYEEIEYEPRRTIDKDLYEDLSSYRLRLLRLLSHCHLSHCPLSFRLRLFLHPMVLHPMVRLFLHPMVLHHDTFGSMMLIEPYIWHEVFKKLLSTGLVPSHDGRILVVGSYGAGKTTLVMNLIYDNIPKESTIGIDDYFGNLLFDVKKRRLRRRRAGQHSFSEALYQKLLAYLKTVDLIQGKGEPENNQWEIIAATMKNIHKKVKMFAQSADAYNEEYIPIPILDFSGQIVYLATHQTFVTSHGIYAVTFNGAKDLHSALKEDFSTVNEKYTILDDIRQLVSSILTYCFKETKGYPKILFVATHRDLLEDKNVEDKREEFLRILRSTLTEENLKSHLMLDTLFFVNATDPEDDEITNLRHVLEKLILENPIWDEKVPLQFRVLEMMLAALVEEGQQIMSRTEIDELNMTCDTPLSEEELDLFLHIQHNCGKLTYLNVPRLKDNVVINPVCLVDVLKSVVNSTLPDLKEGRLRKSDLATLWKSGNFIQFLPFEDYLRELLVHYDILAEVRRYDKETGQRGDVDLYLVPCMATRHNKTSFVRNCLTRDKCISFVFEFKTSVVPSAIRSRMIACLISMWNVKAYENTELLFSGFAGVTVDRKHDLVLQTEGNMLVLILIHKERKQLIVRDLASSVRECLEQNLLRISEVYSFSFSTDLMPKRYVPFQLKVRSGCFNSSCLLDPNDFPQLNQTWRCANHGVETPSSELDIWYTDRGFQECTTSCHGIVEAVLLNDTHLLRICSFLTVEEVRSLAVHLGMSKPELVEVELNNHMPSMLKFYSLRACREKNKSCADFVKAMEQAEINKHTMCKILRQQEVLTDLPDNILKHSPSDEMLDKICLRIGKEWMVLGLELGLEIERLEQIEYDSPRVLREVSRNMLYCWRNRENEATIRELLHALGRCGRNPGLIREILENCDSFPNLKPED